MSKFKMQSPGVLGLNFPCTFCDIRNGSELALKSHMLFQHGKLMPSCSTDLLKQRDLIASEMRQEIRKYIPRLKNKWTVQEVENKIQYCYNWLVENKYTIQIPSDLEFYFILNPLRSDIIDRMKIYYNMQTSKNSIRMYIEDHIWKDSSFDKELMHIVAEKHGLDDTEWDQVSKKRILKLILRRNGIRIR